MEQSMFVHHVTNWIDSYYNADSLKWLCKFIKNSQQPDEVKDMLYEKIELKIASIKNLPVFREVEGKQLLVDGSMQPVIYTTRYAAMMKVIELRANGHDVALDYGNTFYRVELKSKNLVSIVQYDTKAIS